MVCLFSELPGSQWEKGNMVTSVIRGLTRQKQQKRTASDTRTRKELSPRFPTEMTLLSMNMVLDILFPVNPAGSFVDWG